MSGISYETKCPNCGNDANAYSDWKPFDYSSITCMHCGLRIYPTNDYMPLEELNEFREENNLDPIEKLPPQSDNIW